MAIADDLVAGIESLEIGRNAAHRDKPRALDPANFIFPGLTNVHEEDFFAGSEALGQFSRGNFERVEIGGDRQERVPPIFFAKSVKTRDLFRSIDLQEYENKWVASIECMIARTKRLNPLWREGRGLLSTGEEKRPATKAGKLASNTAH